MQAKPARKQLLCAFQKLASIRAGWDLHNDKCRGTATLMINTILELEHLVVEENWKKLLQLGNFPHLREKLEERMWERIDNLSSDMSGHMEGFADLILQMKEVLTEVDDMARIGIKGGVASSEAVPAGDLPPFLVTSISGFGSIAREIVSIYGKYIQELTLKEAMAADIPKTRKRVTLTAYLSAWTVEVYIDQRRIQEIEDILKTESVLAAAS